MKTKRPIRNAISRSKQLLEIGFALVKTFHALFVRPKKIWRHPQKCEVLIYDAVGSKTLVDLIGKHSSVVVPTRGESVNIPCLIKAMTKKSFWSRGQTINTYISMFAIRCEVRLVITFIDNNFRFYSLWKLLPGIQTMMIQNGTRDEVNDLKFGLNKTPEYRVNYALSHGFAQSWYYKQFITGRAEAIGSIKNNFVDKIVCDPDRTIVFVSQFRVRALDNKFLITNRNETVYWDEYFTAEKIIFKFLLGWCKQNNYKLAVCGCQSSNKVEEHQFFSSICSESESFSYLARQTETGSYRYTDAAEIVVTIDSTLGFESLGRGNKTAFFYNRNVTVTVSQLFGWPAVLPESGPFWTNSRSEAEFERVMNSVASATDVEFAKMREPYMDDLMVWDPGNSKAKALIESILDTSKPAIK